MNHTDLQQQPTLSIIVPAYNEEKRLPSTLERLAGFTNSFGAPCEILIIDDGSKDTTREVVRAAMNQQPNLRLIENPHSGKAYTVRTGLLQARGTYALHA